MLYDLFFAVNAAAEGSSFFNQVSHLWGVHSFLQMRYFFEKWLPVTKLARVPSV